MEARPFPNRRGRPLGSKNKPKPPTIIVRDNPNVYLPHVLEISDGADILECLNNYARQKGARLFVMNGSGMVSNVTIRYGTFLTGNVVAYQGAFEIVSVTGMVPAPPPPDAGGLSILLSFGQGQLLGGNVNGPLIATGKVFLTAISFANVVVERLPLEDGEGATQEDIGGSASQGQQVQPGPPF